MWCPMVEGRKVRTRGEPAGFAYFLKVEHDICEIERERARKIKRERENGGLVGYYDNVIVLRNECWVPTLLCEENDKARGCERTLHVIHANLPSDYFSAFLIISLFVL